MSNDNYVERKEYTGLALVDGQLIPQRGDAKPEDLVQTEPVIEEARRNGGGRKGSNRSNTSGE